MKVCFVTTSFIRSSTDYYSYFIYEQAESILQNAPEADVTVVAPSQDGFLTEENVGGVEIKRFTYFWPRRLQKIAYQTDGIYRAIKNSPWALIQVPLFLGSILVNTFRHGWHAQIIHAQWIQTAYVVLPLKLFFPVKIVVSARGADMHGIASTPWKRWFNRTLLNQLDGIFTVSEDFCSILKNQLRVNTPVTPLFNGVDTRHFCKKQCPELREKLNLSAEDRAVLFLGNMIQRKGVDTLLEAFAIVSRARKNVKLLIAGEGPELSNYINLSERLGIRNLVQFFDLVPRAEIPDFLSISSMLVLPSLGEGRPNVVLEAMACKTPVVASDIGGTKELIQHEKTGLMFEPKNAQKLSEQILRILDNPQEANTFAERAHQSLETNGLTWKSHGKRLVSTYLDILREKK